MLPKMRYRLALDMGSTSIGWCLIRLDADNKPVAIIRAGVRIFPDGRNPKDGSSLAVTRRLARQMRRRRDRLLKRKARLIDSLIRLGFFPEDNEQRKALVELDPYHLRRKGLTEKLTPAEFGRALFHLNQRRGFQSNRKTDKKDSDSGLLKTAIRELRERLQADGAETVGEWLARRHDQRLSVRARLRGKTKADKAYDLYVDRAMVAEEFDALWQAQVVYTPDFFIEAKRAELRDVLLHQRKLKPVKPGRCSLLPNEERAPLALPSVQRFRIYQEANNLRLLTPSLGEQPLTLEQRNVIAQLLEGGDVTFTKMLRALKLPGRTKFNLEDVKRDRLKGNATAASLSKPDRFGDKWAQFDATLQDQIVEKLINEASESALVIWLQSNTGVDEAAAESIANAGLPEGYGNLSRAAIARVLPKLQEAVVPYFEAVIRAGFDSHSALSHAEQTGEVMEELPYYGEVLQRHVGFADPNATENDLPEKRFGRIANPTVHIGLNELRKVVNGLIHRYGHPTEVVVEVARELKQSRERQQEIQREQADKQDLNRIHVDEASRILGVLPSNLDRAKRRELSQKMQLWVELNGADAANRRCPYTGEQISIHRLLSDEVEIEHILPFSITLDDSLNNKTVALRRANRDKGNRTPFDAFGHSPPGYDYTSILERAVLMPKEKAKRFAADGYQRWLKEDKDFLARALNDTAYLSRIAKEYLSLICPANKVRAIPGRLTALLRGKFGLNRVLSADGEKNRDDHRHHAVDAAVIGVTDQSLLQKFSQASASSRGNQLGRLVDDMPEPMTNYRNQVARAVQHVVVSHKPDHGHEGGLHNETAYGLHGPGEVVHRVMLDSFKSADDIAKKNFANDKLKQWLLERTAGLSGKEFAVRIENLMQESGTRRAKVIEKLSVIEMSTRRAADRHGLNESGQPRAYKGYKGDSNYCIEITRNAKGKWEGDVISTFEAHQIVREHGLARLRHATLAQNGEALVMRLMIDDVIRLELDGQVRTTLVAKISGNGQVFMADIQEANVDARNRDPQGPFKYTSKMAGSLLAAKARRVTISPTGELRDPGFKE